MTRFVTATDLLRFSGFFYDIEAEGWRRSRRGRLYTKQQALAWLAGRK
jgi:hypothetical protein